VSARRRIGLLVRRLGGDTALEPLARIGWRRLRVGRETGRNARDNALASQVMGRILRRDSNWVDVGTSTGDILWHVLRRAPRGQHVAFEPIPANAAILRARFPPRVTVHCMALSDTAGETEFQHVASNPGYSGLKRRTYPRADERVETIRVPVARLDDMLPPDFRVDAIKVDVEGAELGVLRGAARTIGRWRPYVLFEHGRGAADYYGTTPQMIYDLLVGEYGLQISLPQAWLAGRPPFDRDGFVAQFGGDNCNYLAHPPAAEAAR
jgi:FkbM family methyltransferase